VSTSQRILRRGPALGDGLLPRGGSDPSTRRTTAAITKPCCTGRIGLFRKQGRGGSFRGEMRPAEDILLAAAFSAVSSRVMSPRRTEISGAYLSASMLTVGPLVWRMPRLLSARSDALIAWANGQAATTLLVRSGTGHQQAHRSSAHR
jgi:hypothetical protein